MKIKIQSKIYHPIGTKLQDKKTKEITYTSSRIAHRLVKTIH